MTALDRLYRFLQVLIESQGSDLHVKVGSAPGVRVDGRLRRIEGEEALTADDVGNMAMAIVPNELRSQLDVRKEMDFAYSVRGLGRLRVNLFRQRGSLSMTFRLVQTQAASFEDLGLPPVVKSLAGEHRGLVLVTGPTGSGKTTTLAAMIDWINKNREAHIVTLEDPIEVLHRDERSFVNQREIGLDTDDFATAMRSVMRQDPDVILVGEMRDQETVKAALGAAETGHLVLSTLHTIDAGETINRIVDFFAPHQQMQVRVALAGSLRGIISQRLVPRATGEGRVAALEVLVVTGRIQQCVLEPQMTGEITELIADGEYYGMQTFDQALLKLYDAGAVDLRGAMTAATNPHDLRLMLQQRGLVEATAR